MKSIKFKKIVLFFGIFWYMFAVKPQSFVYAEYYYEDENGVVHWGHVEDDSEEVEPIDDEEMNAFYLVQAELLRKNLDEEQRKDGLISVPTDLGPQVDLAEEAAQNAKDEADDADENENTLTAQNQQQAEENLEHKELPVGGDPVKHSLGSYEQDETDISNGSLVVTRRYSSQNKVVSSMGYGWVTGLDQRIILGVQAGSEQKLQALEDYVQALETLVNTTEREIQHAYSVGNLDYAVSSLESRKDQAYSHIRSADNLYVMAVGLEKGSRGYPAHDVISPLKSGAASLMTSVVNKYNQVSSSISSLRNDIALWERYKSRLEQARVELEEYRGLVSETDNRRYKNRYVIFGGMESSDEETGLDTITVIDEAGYPHLLKETGAGLWAKEDDSLIKQCRSFGDGYEVIQRDGMVKEFDKNGFLVKVTDRNGNRVNIVRGDDGRISAVNDSFGQSYTVTYSGNYIGSIVNDRDGEESVVYGYEGNRLRTVTDTDGDTVTMKYDDGGRMTNLYKCDGSSVEFVYGEVTNDGRILATATKNEEGFEETFDYYPAQNYTVYTDHDGNSTTYIYDQKHRTREEYRADGTRVINEYDTDGNLICINQNGNIITYGYDSLGNKTRAVYMDGTSESWDYDEFNQLTVYTDRDGVTTRYERDSRGNITSCIVGGLEVYSQSVNTLGQVERRTVHGQKDVTTTYIYDVHGNLEQETSGGVKTEYKYDDRNRVTKVTCNDKLLYEYEYRGRSIIRRDYNGLETTYITNGRKDLTELIQKDTVTGVIHKSRIEYDHRHLPLLVFEGDGESETLVTSYQYTPEGKLKAQISHGSTQNWVILYTYENGEVHEVKQYKTDSVFPELHGVPEQTPVVPEPVEGPSDEVYTQTYHRTILSQNGSLLTVTDGLGNETLFEYDSDGNLKTITDAELTVRSKIYSAAGKLKQEQASHGGWYEYKYDPVTGVMTEAGEVEGEFTRSDYYPDGSLKYTVDRYKKTTWYEYDNRGRVTGVLGEVQKIWYEYDSLDRVTKQVVGNTSDEDSAVYYITYEYSDDGRTVTITEGGKYRTVSCLDAFGNVISQTDGNGNTKRYEYDCHNLLVKAYDGYDNATCYEYNALGKVSRVVQPGGAETDYYYNGMGLLEKVTDECGTVYTASYDKAGRLVKERTRADSEKTYEYDKTGRVTAVLCGRDVTESYDYGNDSLTVTVTDGKGEEYIYNYNPYGRLINEVNRKGLVQSYSYDAEGESDGQTSFDGITVTISYSRDRTVRTVHYSDGSENRFVYDAMGNITESSNAYGTTAYQYDRGGRLVYQKDVTTGEEIHFEYDGAGNRTRLYSTNRETVYTYGKNNEIKEIFDNKQRVRVQLDYNINGQEVLRKYANGTREETLYDRAGRVTAKVQKSERGELLWGEGYIYGTDGKRTATVDNAGRVTLYEYNQKGQLSDVYYPYTQSHLEKLHDEAELNGLPANTDPGENRFLSSENYTQLARVLNSMQYGLGGLLTNLQIFIKESYAYDGNGNRVSKTTGYGKIEYAYDKENCLVSSGSRGQTYVTYTYDSAGNLLTEESAMKSTKYAYNAQNRLIYCEVTDRSTREYSQSTYAYDAMGRRVLVQDIDQSALRTLYDGFTFDVIKQSPTFANGLFTDSLETGIRWGASGKPTGERYRYLSDEAAGNTARYVYLDEGSYRTTSSRYYGERSQINANGTLAAQTTTEGGQYFTTDLFGSVISVSGTDGYQLDSYTYDAFGTLVQGTFSGTSDFGYLGKQYDPTTRLYNYGYRDYNPQSARFTTPDPLRDGTNWFSYVNNDPVNFVDLWGLIQTKIPATYTMQGGDWKNDMLNGCDNYTIEKAGCAIICVSNMLNVNPSEINNNYVSNGNIQWYEVGKKYGYTVEKETKGITKNKYLQQASDQENSYTTFINVNWNDTNSEHWVGLNGIETINGTDYCVITISSVNDKVIKNTTIKQNNDGDYYYNSNGNNRLGKGWLNENGQVLVPVDQVKGSVTFKKNCTK